MCRLFFSLLRTKQIVCACCFRIQKLGPASCPAEILWHYKWQHILSTTETDISCSLPDTPDTPAHLTTLTILYSPSTVTKTQQIWRDRFDIRISESFGVSIPATLVVGQANTFVNQQDMQAVQFGNFVRQRAPHGRTVSPNLLPKDPFNAPLINEPLSRRTRPIIKKKKLQDQAGPD